MNMKGILGLRFEYLRLVSLKPVMLRLLGILLCGFALPVAAQNYVLTVDGQSYDFSLGQEHKVQINGQEVVLKVQPKAEVSFETANFSFKHPSKFNPTTQDLGNGITQTALMTPVGTVLLVQEYDGMNPTPLLDLMIKEITKEEQQYGYSIEASPSTTVLHDGKKLQGKVVTSKYKGSDIKRFFYTYGVRDGGLFVMTQIDYEIADKDQALIDLFLKSFNITME